MHETRAYNYTYNNAVLIFVLDLRIVFYNNYQNPRSQYLGQKIFRLYLFGDKIIQNSLKTDATINMIIIYY